MFKKILNFLDEVKIEFKKVVWGTRRDITTATISVIIFVIFVSIILSLLDYVFSLGLKAIFR